MHRSILLAVAFSISTIACQPASTALSEEQKAALADSVTQLSAEMQRAFDNRDAAYFEYFSDWTTSSAAGSRAHEQNRSALVESIWPNSTQTSESGQTRTLALRKG